MIKIYGSGREFLEENGDLLLKYPLETVFFEGNANLITQTNDNDFLVKLQEEGRFLIAVHYDRFPMVIFGDNGLCAEFAREAVRLKLTFEKILGALNTCEAFLFEYEKLVNCTHEINHSMDIMRCDNVLTEDISGVETPTERDVDEISRLAADFAMEAMGDEVNENDVKEKVLSRLQSFLVIRKDNKIVSLASKKRETASLACIADVYTLPQYRNKGLSCKIVTCLTKQIIESGKLAYLFVDKTNPISNRLYQKIGYTYAVPQYDILLKKQ